MIFRSLFEPFHQHGILGINSRNLDYIYAHNPRRLYPIIDNKQETKKIAETVSVPVPETYGTIRFQNQVKQFSQLVEQQNRFVIKPAQGSGGDGILVIDAVVEAGYRKASGKVLSLDDLEFHLHNILSGMYSLSGHTDTVLIEYAVTFDPVFDQIAYQGVPDIRVIIYQGVPAMAMLRLPTRVSDGKANLHRGGIGVGIDLATGKTFGGIQHNQYIECHPETQQPLQGHQIPHWSKILQMAAKLGQATSIGYLGIDIVLDKDLGPLLLEMNARPGISIQIANRTGLKPRLAAIDRVAPQLTIPADRIAFARATFAVDDTPTAPSAAALPYLSTLEGQAQGDLLVATLHADVHRFVGAVAGQQLPPRVGV
ncbi:MAG: alpha-L-glutamate ligase-like protein, partial [Leptolyngbya sp. SIO4C1]|nr:alpha-L-glutamate ligase-like protein [Leptolyngbya sp. SIO4C1]